MDRDVQALLTVEERVDRALTALTAGKTFTPQQKQWLDRIRRHLVENLTVGADDFDVLPVFASRVVHGRTLGGRYLKVICVPDADRSGIFVVTAFTLEGKALAALRRRMRRRGQR